MRSFFPPRWRGAAVLWLCLLVAACGTPTMVVPGGGDYDIRRDIAFGEGPRRQLNVYQPRGPATRRPLVVYFYGGLWSAGAKEDPLSATLAEDLARRGAVVVLPDYRLYPEVTFPAFMEDAGAAIAWAARHAAEYGADPDAIFLAGHSTGAYMALLAGLDRRYIAAAGVGNLRFRGLIGLSGVYQPWLFEHRIMRPIYGPNPDRAVFMPASHMRPPVPPMLLLAGSWDLTVTPDNSTELAAQARAAGGQAEAKLYPRIGHLDILAAGPWLPSFAPTANDMAAFIRANMGP